MTSLLNKLCQKDSLKMIELIPFILYTGLQLMKHKQAKTFTCKQTNCIIIIIKSNQQVDIQLSEDVCTPRRS